MSGASEWMRDQHKDPNEFDLERHLKESYPELLLKFQAEHKRKIKYQNNLSLLTGKWVRVFFAGHGGMGMDARKVEGLHKSGRYIELSQEYRERYSNQINKSISLIALDDKEMPWFTQFYVVEDEPRDKRDEALLKGYI